MINDGHAINGTWLSTLGCETRMPITMPELAGGDLSLPYDPQELPGTKTPKGRDYVVELIIKGWDTGVGTTNARPEFMTRAFAIGELMFNDGEPFSLGRRILLTSGLQTVYTLARYIDGYDVDNIAPPIGKAVVRFRMLWPAWYSTPPALLSPVAPVGAPAPITPGGTQSTTRVTLTFSGGEDQVLTNEKTGDTIQVLGSTVEPVTIDAFAKTVKDTEGRNVLARARFSGGSQHWMKLATTENTFTLSGGGGVAIRYWPAY